MTVVILSVAYVQVDCATCGFTFAVPESLIERRRRDGLDFFCPAAAHRMNYGKTEADRLREQVAGLQRRVDAGQATLTAVRDQRDAAERARRAQVGVVTKLRKRVSNGICPCCRRTFADLARHIAGQHPDFAAEVPDAAADA